MPAHTRWAFDKAFTVPASMAAGYVTFRLDFHHLDRFALDLRGHIHVRGAAFSCLRLT